MSHGEGLHCPECGYDLRATDSGRCPECGSAFDRERMTRSQVAWEHREQIGRTRAWWRTIWQATFRVKQLSDSISAPVDWHAARRFWLINCLLLYLPIAVLLAFLGEQWRERAGQSVRIVGLGMRAEVWQQELLGPLAMGYAIPGVSFVVPLLLLMTCTGVQTYLLQSAPISENSQNRAAALGLYLSGAWVGGVMIAMAGTLVLVAILLPMTPPEIVLSVPAGLSLGLLLAVVWRSTWLIYRRVTRAGALRSLVVGVAIPACWLLGVLLWGFILPWCIGLLGLIVGSLFF